MFIESTTNRLLLIAGLILIMLWIVILNIVFPFMSDKQNSGVRTGCYQLQLSHKDFHANDILFQTTIPSPRVIQLCSFT